MIHFFQVDILVANCYPIVALRQHLISLNKKLDKGEAEAFAASEAALQKSADIVQTSVKDEREIVKAFRYLY